MSGFMGLKPMLYTKELTETIAFYTDVLGFECLAFEEEWGWASLRKDNVEIMLACPNEHIPFLKPAFTGSLYISTGEVNELWDKYRHTCKVCYEIENFNYGMREFAIYDNNGYLLQFGQQLD